MEREGGINKGMTVILESGAGESVQTLKVGTNRDQKPTGSEARDVSVGAEGRAWEAILNSR